MDNQPQALYFTKSDVEGDPLRGALSELPAGKSGVVSRLWGGKAFMSRAAALGFTIGAPVTVVQNYGRGPMIVTVRGTRLALGRGEALMIQVEPL